MIISGETGGVVLHKTSGDASPALPYKKGMGKA